MDFVLGERYTVVKLEQPWHVLPPKEVTSDFDMSIVVSFAEPQNSAFENESSLVAPVSGL